MNSGGKVLSVVIPIYNEVNIEPNITRSYGGFVKC